MTPPPPIRGTCDSRFAPVRDAFARAFTELGETGAAACVVVDGRVVVDLQGGFRDPDDRDPWRPDTLVNVYSVTKPFVAMALLGLIAEGGVELDAPVARYWPEFAAAGKERVPVRWVLTHQTGLLGLREPLPRDAMFDWDAVAARLAAEAPWSPPGEQPGECAIFFGHLVGEIVRRVTGRTVGEFLRSQTCGPWGIDLFVGLRDQEILRVADLTGMDAAWRARNAPPGSLRARVLDNPPASRYPEVVNGRAWRCAEIPAVNGHASARAIARFYGGLARGGVLDGVRIAGADRLAAALDTQVEGVDEVVGEPVRWGLGFMLDDDGFGMGGLGGSLGWGHAPTRFGFGYVTRRMGEHERASAVHAAAARCAGCVR